MENYYSKIDAKFRVCELVNGFGRAAEITAITSITALHDRLTRIESNAPLA